MKNCIDITLSILHCGVHHKVATLAIDGKDLAARFLEKLLHDDRNQWKFIKTRIITVSNYERYENTITFRHLEDGLYEFKRPGLRLYAFYDTIEDTDHLIICTNGGTKNTKKAQSEDIRKALERKQRYFEAKSFPHAKFTINDPIP
ncbi:MAG: hypothetical protein ACLFS4_05130 [Opitutales bacterium]